MSYDCSLQIDTGGHEPVTTHELGNYTYNCSGMLVAAIGISLGDLNGKPANEAWKILERAIAEMRNNPDKYRAMNPENGWGKYETWLEYLTGIANACRDNPKCFLRVS